MNNPSSIHDLKSLILSCNPLVVIETVEEERAINLVESAAKQVYLPIFEWSITQGMYKRVADAIANRSTAEPIQALSHMRGLAIEAIFLLKDFAPHLSNPTIARYLRELCQTFTKTKSTIVITGEDVKLPAEIEQKCVRYKLSLPTEQELEGVMRAVVNSFRQQGQDVASLAQEDVNVLLRSLRGLTLNQARQTLAQAILNDGILSIADVAHIFQRKMQIVEEGGLLEYYPVEDNFYQLGGFQKLKAWLDRAQLGFSEKAKTLNLKPPRGILLVGVQGCGKSLAAKFVGRSWSLPILKLDAGRLFDKYIGESEKNFRKAISLAESLAPTVLWIDEIEKALATGSNAESDGGLSKRLFGAFLTWMQEKKADVFVVGTANDIFVLPPELLRKGRFDEIFFVDLPTAQERYVIFKIHLELRKQSVENFDLDKIVIASEGFSGAEIEQAVIAGLYRGLQADQPMNTAMLLEEIQSTVPLSKSRREDIQRLRTLGKDRFVPVS